MDVVMCDVVITALVMERPQRARALLFSKKRKT